jgi:hypothetical protein
LATSRSYEQLVWLDAERISEPPNLGDSDLTLGSLDEADLGAMQPSGVR